MIISDLQHIESATEADVQGGYGDPVESVPIETDGRSKWRPPGGCEDPLYSKPGKGT